MDGLREYLERHRTCLLKYLDGEVPATGDELDSLGYVTVALDDWRERFGKLELPEPEPEERTFWFVLYQLEELTEYPAVGDPEPYEAVLLQDLANARELLRKWRPLPPGLFATRPDGT